MAAIHAWGECHARLISNTDSGTAIGEGPLRGSAPWKIEREPSYTTPATQEKPA